MIGIWCKQSERELVEEFFELFKTPWEFFQEGHLYDVVISTWDEPPRTQLTLLILFSSTPTRLDTRMGTQVEPRRSKYLTYDGSSRLPIYGGLASLSNGAQALLYDETCSNPVVLKIRDADRTVIRAGYNLFEEIAFLLTYGQPPENALCPTLESHTALLRDWILEAGIPIVEIPSVPWGYRFIACLTHDVDFVGIRQHRFDHTFWGFVYRAVVGTAVELVGGRRSLGQLIKNWTAVASLPLIYLGLLKDFWDQFEKYAEIDKDFSSTFFLIPFEGRVGDKLQGQFMNRRAAHYGISDVTKQIEMLIKQGYEIGLHGIDAWHSAEKGMQELRRIVKATGQQEVGVRMHWLYLDRQSPAVLEQAGFDYDSTFGYNETVGYRAGTLQVFRPLGVTHLLELPLHIQDTALFFPGRMGLTDNQAWDLCSAVIDTVAHHGGVLTILWHLRSLAPERLWGEFYIRLQRKLQRRGAWLSSAGQVVRWFRQRRSVVFKKYSSGENKILLLLNHDDLVSEACLFLRVHRPRKARAAGGRAELDYFDVLWNGESSVEISLS